MTPINLPYPISANRYWRRAGKYTHVSAAAKAYKQKVGIAALSAGLRVLDGPVRISLALQPKLTKAGAASKTRLDLDNCIKVALDSLNGFAYLDDSQVVALSAYIAPPVADGGLIVIVERAQKETPAT